MQLIPPLFGSCAAEAKAAFAAKAGTNAVQEGQIPNIVRIMLRPYFCANCRPTLTIILGL
jgi:hypothetical protein